jgi:hypothetical protein
MYHAITVLLNMQLRSLRANVAEKTFCVRKHLQVKDLNDAVAEHVTGTEKDATATVGADKKEPLGSFSCNLFWVLSWSSAAHRGSSNWRTRAYRRTGRRSARWLREGRESREKERIIKRKEW